MAAIDGLEMYRRLRPGQILAIMRGIESATGSGGAHPLPGGKGDAEFTIEHIAPQSLKEWHGDLLIWGIHAVDLEREVHTLGNLTAATNKHNKSVGSKRLAAKQKRLLTEPKLWANEGWARKKRWGPAEIRARSRLAAKRALAYWSAF
jgi:hypothetical protein